MPVFDPFDAPQDYVVMAGVNTPGIAEVYDVTSEFDWSERRGIGYSGATLRYLGKKLCRFKVALRLLTPEAMDAWAEFRRVIAPPPPDPPSWTGEDAASLAFLETDLQADPNFELARTQRVTALRQRRQAAAVTRPPGSHVDVQHPLLELHGITAAAVLKIDGPRDAGGNGEWMVELTMIEFRRPTFAIATPAGASDGPPEARDPNDQLINRLAERVETLGQINQALAAR